MANEEKKENRQMECPGNCALWMKLGEIFLHFWKKEKCKETRLSVSVYPKWIKFLKGEKEGERGFEVNYNSRTTPTFIGGR